MFKVQHRSIQIAGAGVWNAGEFYGGGDDKETLHCYGDTEKIRANLTGSI